MGIRPPGLGDPETGLHQGDGPLCAEAGGPGLVMLRAKDQESGEVRVIPQTEHKGKR